MLNGCPPEVSSLLRAISAAGARVDEWPGVLERLCRYFDARVVTLGHHEFTTGSDSAMFESPGNTCFSAEMAAFSARNPWFLSSEDYVPGRVMSGEDLISNNDLRRTDFYRGFLQPRHLLHRLCGVVAQRAEGAFFVSAYRAEDQGEFGASEKAEMQILLDHITLSLESHWRWQEADDLARAMFSLSDHDANPMLMVTADAQPVYRNSAADFLLEEGVGLRLEGSRVVAASAADQRLLREAIARVAQGDLAQGNMSPCVLTLASPAAASGLVVVLRPVGQVFTRELGVRQGLAVVTVRGSHALHDPASCAFVHQYDLTAAQAKVSSLVIAGQSLPKIALSLNVSENTVRSHLKQIFQKTDTHGQMDLVHLHARVCPVMT